MSNQLSAPEIQSIRDAIARGRIGFQIVDLPAPPADPRTDRPATGDRSMSEASPHDHTRRSREAFGRKVRQFRNIYGMTHADLAGRMTDTLGSEFQSFKVERTERGARPVPIEEVFALAHVFGVAPTELVPSKDTPYSNPSVDAEVMAAIQKLIAAIEKR